MSNPVLSLTRNNLTLTKSMVESVRAQDIPTQLFILDNDSHDGTRDWLDDACAFDILQWDGFSPQIGVSAGWNWGLHQIFLNRANDHCLVIGNDTILPSWFLRVLLEYLGDSVPFITGVGVDDLALAMNPDAIPEPLTPDPDFSAYLISRKCWEAVGQFDETLKFYCQDQDYHLRAWRKGIPLYKINVRFWHKGSATLKLEGHPVSEQADRDRARLREKWGCDAGGKSYEALFTAETFGIDSPAGTPDIVVEK